MAHAIHPAAAIPGRMVLPALCAGSFITTLHFAAPGPFLPAISRDLGVSVALLGQITAVMLILSAILSLVVGPLADAFGAKRFIVGGLAAVAISLFDYGLAPVFAVLFVASVAGGIAEATVPGLSLAIAGSRFSGPAARRAIGWTIGALASAPIVGVPALTTIGDLTSWRVAFLVAGMAAIAVAVMVAAWLPDDIPEGREPIRWSSILAAYPPLLHDAGMRRLYAATLARAICWLGVLTYLGALLEDRYDMATGEIGVVYMIAGAGYFAGSLAAGGPLGRLAPRPLVAVSNVVLAVLLGVIFTAVAGSVVTIALLTVATFAAAVGWVGLTALIGQETPGGASTTMVLNMALFNVGAAAGAGLGGVLLAVGDFGGLAAGLPLFGLAAAVLVRAPGRNRALA